MLYQSTNDDTVDNNDLTFFVVQKMNKLVLCALLVLAVVALSDARGRRGGFGGHGGRGGTSLSAGERSFAGKREGLNKGNRGRLVSKRLIKAIPLKINQLFILWRKPYCCHELSYQPVLIQKCRPKVWGMLSQIDQ